METVKINTSQHIDIDYPVAGLGERLASWFIDTGIFVVLWFIGFILFAVTGAIQSSPELFFILVVIFTLAFSFYDLICEIFMNGQSFGKRILKIKVISLNGAQPSLGQYFIRWIFRLVDFSILTGYLGGLICIAVSERKQRIGDMVAGTTVIKTQPKTHLQHIAFHPVADDYQATFSQVYQLSDHDIELIHEVLTTYYKTYNVNLVYHMAARVASLLSVNIPEGMNELDFLKTVLSDYSHETSKAV